MSGWNWTIDGEIKRLRAQLASVTASLEDAHKEVRRLSAEKHARDDAIRKAMAVLDEPYKPVALKPRPSPPVTKG